MFTENNTYVGDTGLKFYSEGRTFEEDDSALSFEDFQGENGAKVTLMTSPSSVNMTVFYTDTDGNRAQKDFRHHADSEGVSPMKFIESLF